MQFTAHGDVSSQGNLDIIETQTITTNTNINVSSVARDVANSCNTEGSGVAKDEVERMVRSILESKKDNDLKGLSDKLDEMLNMMVASGSEGKDGKAVDVSSIVKRIPVLRDLLSNLIIRL